jgi:hypothetical protein
MRNDGSHKQKKNKIYFFSRLHYATGWSAVSLKKLVLWPFEYNRVSFVLLLLICFCCLFIFLSPFNKFLCLLAQKLSQFVTTIEWKLIWQERPEKEDLKTRCVMRSFFFSKFEKNPLTSNPDWSWRKILQNRYQRLCSFSSWTDRSSDPQSDEQLLVVDSIASGDVVCCFCVGRDRCFFCYLLAKRTGFWIAILRNFLLFFLVFRKNLNRINKVENFKWVFSVCKCHTNGISMRLNVEEQFWFVYYHNLIRILLR